MRCCYKSPPDVDGNQQNCQFDSGSMEHYGIDRQLVEEIGGRRDFVEIGGLPFCPFHVPYFKETFGLKADGVRLSDEDLSRLKDRWAEPQVKRFRMLAHEMVLDCRQRNAPCNLTGAVLLGPPLEDRERQFPSISLADAEFHCEHPGFQGAQFVSHDQTTFAGARFFCDSVSFKDARFEGGVCFDGARFASKVTTFEAAAFKGEGTEFRRATFEGDAQFQNAKFVAGSTTFEDSRFVGDVSFRSARFESSTVNFEHVLFERNLAANHAVFMRAEVTFQSARFLGNREANFSDSVFSSARFDGPYFSAPALFNSVRFDKMASFSNVRFAGIASTFAGAWFENCLADFEKAKFSASPAVFVGARFGRGLLCNDVHFDGGDADFEDTSFFGGGSLRCHSARFARNANFAAARADEAEYALGAVDFSHAVFHDSVDFANRRFNRTALFSGAVFHGVPAFHGANLHQETRFPSIKSFRDTRSPNAAYAYRTLRLAMANQKSHEEEAMFWALEQKAKRRTLKAGSWIARFISLAYELFANYGLSIGRPLAWLGGLTLIEVAWLYPRFQSPAVSATWDSRLASGLTAAMQQTIRPFWIWTVDGLRDTIHALGDPVGVNALGLRLVATADSLLSVLLLLLFILAIRRRFRLE